jgi:hypothetical protein
MGTWGPGVYQNDHALDLLSSVYGDLQRELEAAMNQPSADWSDIEGPLVYVHVMALMAKDYTTNMLKPSMVEEWKARYLKIYDESLGDDADKRRRAIIAKTFDKLLAGLQKEEAPPKPKKKAQRPKR